MYGNAFHPGRFFQGKGGVDAATHHRRYPGAFGPANRNSYLAHAENQVPLKPKVITIVRNGAKPRNNVKILLNRRSVQSFEQLMGDISEAFGPKWKGNKVRKLFTTRGREVQGVADFFRDDDVFIGVGNEPLTETDVHDIIEEVYPDSPYAKNIMKDFERHKRKRLSQAKDSVRDDADKRDSGFGEGSDGSSRDPPEEYVLYKGRQADKSRRRNEYPKDMEITHRLDREKEKAAQEEKDRVRKQREKMRDSERRAVEDENRKRRQVPKEKADDPLKRLREQKEKEKEDIRRRREEERQQREEEERQRKEEERQRRDEEKQRKEKERQEREQAEAAARERQAAAERERKEKEKAERKAAREKELRDKEAKEKEAAKEREKHEKEKQEKETHKEKESEKEKEVEHEKDHDEKSEKAKAEKAEKDNREAEKRKKKTTKSKIVRKTKLERQISSDDHVLAKYELGATLGDGNFAIVRMCKLKATGTQYAMKVIDKPKLKGKEHMVENEIEIMKDCNHPNIVKLYEEYETADKIYLVMELVKVS